MYVILGLIIAVMGIVMIVNPEGFYEVTQGWKSRGGEPSDAYILHTRIGGVLCLLVGGAGAVILLFSL